MSERLRDELLGRGATEDEIAAAEFDGTIIPLAIERLLLPGRPVYNREQLAEVAGVDLDLADSLWHALGFPSVPDDAVMFTLQDAQMLRAWSEQGAKTVLRPVDNADLVQQSRIMSGFLARLAEHQADLLNDAVRVGRVSGMNDDELALFLVEGLSLDTFLELIGYSLRLHLRDAVWRRMATEQPDEIGALTLAIGFVDLVGYTSMAQQLEDIELAALVTEFEQVAHDVVVSHGGRVVKTIGDEVMFVCDDAGAAVSIAYALVAGVRANEQLPAARAGVAYGRVLAREGDYFGPVVNLAHRVGALAFPNTTVVTESLFEALAGDERFEFRSMRPRKVRDVGTIPLWAVRGVPDAE